MVLQSTSVSVVLPTYNERETVARAMPRIIAALQERLMEIIVVDDNSPDRTWEVVEQFGDPRCRVIRRTTERGLASALARGTREAKGDAIVWMDCDLGMPPEDIPRLVDALETHDIAVGSRYVRGGRDGRSAFRGFLSYCFNLYTRVVLGQAFWDWTSGFAAVRCDALRSVPLSSSGYGEYFTEWIYCSLRAGLRVIEVPYVYSPRTFGESKTDSNILVFIRLAIQYVFRVLQIRLRGGRRPIPHP